MESSKYAYRANPSLLCLSSMFSMVLATFLAYQTSTNDSGLAINGMLHLDASSATLFYGFLALLAFGLVAYFVTALWVSVIHSPVLELTEHMFARHRRPYPQRASR